MGARGWDGGRDGRREGGIAAFPSFGPALLPWPMLEGGAGWEGRSEGGGERMYHQYQQRRDYNMLGEARREGRREGRRGKRRGIKWVCE